MEKTGLKRRLIDFLIMNFGMVSLAAGIYFFKLPNNFSTGGVTGAATVVAALLGTKATPGGLILVINTVLLIVGAVFLGREFAWKTVYCSLGYSLLTLLWEHVLPLKAPLTDQPFLELVYAMLITSVGSALMFYVSASSGGTDIVSLILKKYTQVKTGTALFFTDSVIACSAIFVFGIKTGLFSILGLLMKAFLVDNLLESVNLCKYFTIITEKPEEINDYILRIAHRGVTVVDAVGAFSQDQKKMLLTVCPRMEAIRLKHEIRQIDPHAFIVVTNTSEIIGRGFRGV